MIDKQAILERIDLLQLVTSAIKRVATTGGGEFAGACPFCGGVDRFRVQPNYPGGGRWLCRHCTEGKWKNVIDYVIRSENLPDDGKGFKAACALLGGPNLPATKERRPPPATPAYQPPPAEWQESAWWALDKCQVHLWGDLGGAALDYLRGRGLEDDVIKTYRLGYSPGAKFGDLWIPRGVVIPCIAGPEIWYIKVRLLPGDPCSCHACKASMAGPGFCPSCGTLNKYRGVKGNRPAAIFGADNLAGADWGVFVEGEFDVMILDQVITLETEARGKIGVATLGSATNRPDLATWGRYLIPLKRIYAIYDNDPAGQAGAAALAQLGERVTAAQLPEGAKDINDYYQAGGDLVLWLLGDVLRGCVAK